MPFWFFKRRRLPKEPRGNASRLEFYLRKYRNQKQAVAVWVMHTRTGNVRDYPSAVKLAQDFLKTRPEEISEKTIRAFAKEWSANSK